MIDLHFEAKSNINRKADDLLKCICDVNSPKLDSSPSQHFSSATITEKDIKGEIIINHINFNGEKCGFVFFRNNTGKGIIDNEYLKLKSLVEIILKDKTLQQTASNDYIEDNIKDWLIKKFDKQYEFDLCTYILSNLEKDIINQDVWIPVPQISIEENFSFGGVSFKTLTEGIIENWIKYDRVKLEDIENDRKIVLSIRKEYQGFAFFVCKINAESNKAKEIAFQKASDVFAVIRLFTPSNLICTKSSNIYEYGWKYEERENFFIIGDDGKIKKHTEGIRGDSGFGQFKKSFIEMISKSSFNKLLEKENKNQFQIDLMDAIRIYSKNTLKKEIYDKLLYILVALESILLKNDTEPIQQNLADRIAFICGKTIDERRKIVSIVKKIYTIRSEFIHHGHISIEHKELIEEFMFLAWRTFNIIIANMEKFTARLQFIEAIENIKYSS